MSVRFKEIDIKPEKRILTDLIVDTPFCQNFIPTLKPLLARKGKHSVFTVRPIKIVIPFVLDYFDKWGTAPGRNFETLYEKEIAPGLDEEDTEWVTTFLVDLSEEYETVEREDLAFRLQAAKDFVKGAWLNQTGRQLQDLIGANKPTSLKKAIALFESATTTFQETIKSDGIVAVSAIEAAVLSTRELINKEVDRPVEILSPWLTDGSINMLYGKRGVGKTYLALSIACAVSGYGQQEMGKWEVKNKSGVLYLDGEMREYDLQSRLKQLLTEKQLRSVLRKRPPLPDPDREPPPLDILCNAVYRKKNPASMNLADPAFRDSLYEYLDKHKEFYLLIVDNISALTPSIDENVKKDWDPINQWLLGLRSMQVATLFIHHAGKGGEQRGTSGREDSLDTVIELSRPDSYSADMGLFFQVKYEKARNVAPNVDLRPFDLRLTEAHKWEIASGKNYKEKEIKVEILSGRSLRNLEQEFGVSKSSLGRIRKQMTDNGLLRDGTPTKKGHEWLKNIKAETVLEA